ncbi:esterase [Sinosporangium siamense]|uniref:Esterase n=3 Tax=Sinosporangium siamense TaxID=1367973 RepID=A0A919V7D4_9ACTN|nr:esterase [Sinosporangium siamense]
MLHMASAAGAGALTMAAGVGAPKKKRKEVTTFVFVSGAHGAAGVDPELAMRGHRTVGVGLQGHDATGQFHISYQAPQDLKTFATLPSPMAGLTLDDYVEATVKVVRRVANYGPVILVGGSMGGATITKAADEVPKLIDRLVYSSAFICSKMRTIVDYLSTPEASTSLLFGLAKGAVGDPAQIKASRTNWRSNNPEFLRAAKQALMADASDGEFLATLNTMSPDEALSVPVTDARGRVEAWGRVPRTYIRHSRDLSIPLPLQDRMIREADELTPKNKFDVKTVDATHAPTAKAYEKITDILHKLA